MKKSNIIWLCIAACLTISGALIFTVALYQANWDFASLSTGEFTTTTYEINEEFKDISIDIATSDITILPSPDGKCRLECHDQEGARHTFFVENGELKINLEDSRKWYERIGNFDSTKITVYLPDSFSGKISVEATTSDVTIKNVYPEALEIDITTGDILIENVLFTGNVELELSTGEAMLKNIKCASLLSDAGTGDILLEDVIAQGKFEIKRTTGDVKFVRCDAAEIYVNTNTGDVTGTLLSEKNFSAQATTGDVHVPNTDNGGICRIHTTTGDIRIRIAD